MSNEIREPKQKRSIETKKKIIYAGYKLFSEEGYYSTNTAAIAKEAGVSTGIVYGYFKDKRDILLEVLDIYITEAFRPILNFFDDVTPPFDFARLASEIIDEAINIHKKYAKIHEALHSLTASDDAVQRQFINSEDKISELFGQKLLAAGLPQENLTEKIHLAMNLVQSFAHEYVYDKHEYIDYAAMRGIVCNIIQNLFEKN